MADIIKCNLSDANDTVDEAKLKWIQDTLIGIGVDESVLELNGAGFTQEMSDLGIEVELLPLGAVDVYKLEWSEYSEGWLPATSDHLVGQWREPERIKRIDEDGVYYELHMDEWSFSSN